MKRRRTQRRHLLRKKHLQQRKARPRRKHLPRRQKHLLNRRKKAQRRLPPHPKTNRQQPTSRHTLASLSLPAPALRQRSIVYGFITIIPSSNLFTHVFHIMQQYFCTKPTLHYTKSFCYQYILFLLKEQRKLKIQKKRKTGDALTTLASKIWL